MYSSYLKGTLRTTTQGTIPFLKYIQIFNGFSMVRHFIPNFSSSHWKWWKIDVLKNFAKFTGKHLCQNFFVNKVARPGTFFTEHIQATASEFFGPILPKLLVSKTTCFIHGILKYWVYVVLFRVGIILLQRFLL